MTGIAGSHATSLLAAVTGFLVLLTCAPAASDQQSAAVMLALAAAAVLTIGGVRAWVPIRPADAVAVRIRRRTQPPPAWVITRIPRTPRRPRAPGRG